MGPEGDVEGATLGVGELVVALDGGVDVRGGGGQGKDFGGSEGVGDKGAELDGARGLVGQVRGEEVCFCGHGCEEGCIVCCVRRGGRGGVNNLIQGVKVRCIGWEPMRLMVQGSEPMVAATRLVASRLM